MKPKLRAVPDVSARPPATLPTGVPQFLNVEEVAAMLQLEPRTIYNMVSQRRIPFRRAGRQLRFNPKEIDEWTKEAARP
jgi:excisionase family DNA binding protein